MKFPKFQYVRSKPLLEACRKIACRNAEAKIWPLLGYELRTILATEP